MTKHNQNITDLIIYTFIWMVCSFEEATITNLCFIWFPGKEKLYKEKFCENLQKFFDFPRKKERKTKNALGVEFSC